MTTLRDPAQQRAGRSAAAGTAGPAGGRDDVLPVILGGDIGAYSLARSFHEAYGVRSVVVSQFPTGVVRRSSIVTSVVEPQIDDVGCLVARLRQIARATSATCLLLGSADWHVRRVVEHRERLEDLFVIPYPRREVLDRATDKERFSRLCAGLGIGHPQTVVYDLAAPGPDWGSGRPPATLDYPVVAKAASTTAYHEVDFPGKKKVYHLDTAARLDDLMERLTWAGYTGRFLVQRTVGGDDAQMRILTCYSDRHARVRFASFGHVLLEEHTPGALGNPAGIVTTRADEVVAQAVRLLEHIGWTGFSNFDIKVDPVDGTYRFFELNPRLGRSNYYVTAGGHNPATYYVTEHVDGLDVGTLLGGAPARDGCPDDERWAAGFAAWASRQPHGPAGKQALCDALTRLPDHELKGLLSTEARPGWMDTLTRPDDGPLRDVVLASDVHLYTVLPHRLLLSYLDGPLREQTEALIAAGAVTNPLWYRHDRDPRRLAYLAAAQVNQLRKYRRYHPRHAPTGAPA